jgi:RHS repeat-associated protein
VTINRVYASEVTPIQGVRVYLFTEGGSYLSGYAHTDGNGQVVFNLPGKNYKVRADHLSSQYWSSVFKSQDVEVDIAHGKVNVHVTNNGEDVADVPVYLFTATGSYLGKSQRTDTSGHAAFDIPAKAYKLRVDYNGNQYWSGVVNVIAHEETQVDMALEQLALIPTNNPKPSRYDGEPLEDNSGPVRVAALGSLVCILTQATIASSPFPSVYYYLNDHLGTPQSLMDATGALRWKATYKPFGEAMTDPASTRTSDFRFPGQYFDTDTGLHYNCHRYYDSRTGRYLTPDPLGIRPGLNVYVYVLNRPANLIDPIGLWTASVHRLLTQLSMQRKAYFTQAGIEAVTRANIRVDRLTNQFNDAAHYMPGTSD